MFHKVKEVTVLSDFRLCVQFAEGITKLYDVKPLYSKWVVFKNLEDNVSLFNGVEVDTGGYGIIWNDEPDLSCDELYANGLKIQTIYDYLMSFADLGFK